MRANILIFCDGGLGNRINALASGLALARRLGLSYAVHWPINNWCAAPFEKIFANKLNISTESISQLRGQLDDAIMLLHDEIASSTLNVKFDSAYRFKDIYEFNSLPELRSKTVFYYPALIPNWIPEELVNNELRFLNFAPYIVKEVKNFITNTMPGPYHGLHLRRTDLNVGLSDLEVFNLAKAHPDEFFFVCSDDQQAECLAAGHPNVFRRDKKFYVEKKSAGGDWLAQTHDDDGRLYCGNIQRDENAVVEGAVDMLILAHSDIVGFSGSTFQKIAQRIGQNAKIVQITQPQEVAYVSPTELEKNLKRGLLDIPMALDLVRKVKNKELELNLLSICLRFCNVNQRDFILYSIGLNYIKSNRIEMAEIYMRELLNSNTKSTIELFNLPFAQIMQKKFK